ncbi:MAG: PAS domain S-box protein [Myxococcales bacterium]|nr:PAS domain S-box protein [Myxococcales bacterium]
MPGEAKSEGAGLLEALFHSHAGLKLLIDPADGRIVDANPAAVAFYGYAREALLAMRISQINVAPAEQIAASLARAASRAADSFEFRHRLADGRVRDMAISSSPVTMAGRTLLFSILHDVTDRVEAERALRSAQVYQRALFDGILDGVVVASLDGRIIDVNPRAEALFGRDRLSLLGMSHAELFREEDRPRARQRFEARATSTAVGALTLVEYTVERPDHTQVPVEIAGSRLTLGDGTQVLLGVFRDVSARKASEQEVRRLSQIIEQSPTAIMVTDLSGATTWVNGAFTALTGYARDEVLGKNPRLLKSGETAGDVFAHLWATIAAGRVWQGEVVNRKKSGELYREALVISPLRDAAGQLSHYVAEKEDVTERHRLEDELRRAQRLEAIGQLAGGVAHDFNNLLAVQQMNVSLLLRREDLPEAARELVHELEQSAQVAADVTRQLLAFGRRQRLEKQVVSLDGLVGEVMKLLHRVMPENISLLHLPAADPTWVSVDVGAAEQTVMNLVVNARDAMPSGGTCTIAVQATDNGRSITLSVTDTGHGIPPEVLAHIFEPFFTTRQGGRGTGLGLATVYGLVVQHGGLIEVDSAPGRGATFRIKLPAAPPPSEDRPAVVVLSPQLDSERRRVLLVEDSEDVRRSLRRVLEGLGCEVQEACSAADALAQWKAAPDWVDVLLTDVVMPGALSGVQLARQLKVVRPELFVIIASGYTGGQSGALEPDFHFLAKPFRVEELSELLASAPPRRRRP